MANVVEAVNLSKKYGNVYGVKDLNFGIEEGSIYGFIGPNGAGKTTTIALLTGILEPTEGIVLLYGKPLKQNMMELKKRIGVVPDNPYVYNHMSAVEYLAFFADLYDVEKKQERIEELLSYFNLMEHRDKQLRKYSKGMKQKINIARALVHDPDLLFLDEPIQGLDPTGVKEVRDVILGEKKKGKTVFISSHILSEMDKFCDQVGIINKGSLVMSGSMDKLKKSIKSGIELEIELDKATDKIIDSLKTLEYVKEVAREGNKIKVRIEGSADLRKEISRQVTLAGGVIIAMKEDRVDLEAAFVELTKEEK